MKIVQIIPNLADGGAERFVFDLSNDLVKIKSVELHLITLFNIEPNNILFKNLNPLIEVHQLGKKMGLDIQTLRKLRFLIFQLKPDIIHTHLNSINYLFLALRFNLFKFKVVHTVHNDAKKEVSGKKELLFRKILFFLNRNIYPVTISYGSKESFKIAYPGVKDRMIYNGRVEPRKSFQYQATEDFFVSLKNEFGEDVRILVNIGRIVPQKNQLNIAKAIHQLKENVVFLILGSSRKGYSEEIIKGINDLNSSRIRLMGNVPNPIDYLFLSDFFILTSNFEGMPISLIEALACGIIPIISDEGGMREMVKEDGVLSTCKSPECIKKSIIKAMNIDEKNQMKMRQNLQFRFKNEFDIEICSRKYFEMFNSIL